ncbi:DUF3696 domain-containing protein [Tenacibaculum ovolyticum]|uniref:DUF3696 domain-containing protein n=1 Tax=Tenacibaculum ovolyticum TaxID=104270 RepID=UPI0022F3A416|nr:DUF3696 domain-containing protein [Tenacibaculum ovolyticum]WBX78133.1 DUF3696 domain-containing protein [Tenacibaculum ovolyticum]
MAKFKIDNFKCFNNVEVDLNKLTIMTGANGAGKSTVIQSLLFLRRTVEHCGEWNKKSSKYDFNTPNGLNVELNKSYCLSLGDSSLIIPNNSSEIEIKFEILDDTQKFQVIYQTSEDASLFLTPIDSKNIRAENLFIFKQEFYYLNAERLGPRVKQDVTFYDYPNTGYKGEHVAQLLGDTNFSYRFKVNDKRKYKDVNSPNLISQVNAWLNFIMPGISVDSSYSIETLSAQIKIKNSYTGTSFATAPNIGFGISYVLPIIVTGLIAEENACFIVENPEAHLHPSAQSKIGRFLAMVAKSGVRVIIETHSDHIINGIQVSSMLNEIEPDSISINFFNKTSNSEQPEVESISLNNRGELSKWPQGFFDQSQRDYAELLTLRKNG